jgi:hypothetical protein
MKKLGYVIAALGAIAIAAPSIASAEIVVVKHHDHMHRVHEGMHHPHANRIVVVKHRHHEG